jgi:DNA-binding CsgD family transcriptional regulator
VRRTELADRYLQQSLEYAVARDIDANRRYAQAWLARVRFDQGRWEEAEEMIGPDLSECRVGSIVSETVRGRLLARQGRSGAAAALAAAWDRATQTQDIQRMWPAVAGRIELAWLTDTLCSEVVADLLTVLDMADGRGMPHAIGELGWWAWKVGVRSEPLPAEAAGGYRLHVAGDLAGAAAAWDSLGAPYEAAMALADGDGEASLRCALERFVHLGASPMAQRTRRRLREGGARAVPRGPRRTTAASSAGLTARECDVVALVAAGLTNRDIAARLHVSDRTVGHHVAAILRKLGVKTRTEAAVAAAAQGLTGAPT